jgi:hypothetical protein
MIHRPYVKSETKTYTREMKSHFVENKNTQKFMFGRDAAKSGNKLVRLITLYGRHVGS